MADVVGVGWGRRETKEEKQNQKGGQSPPGPSQVKMGDSCHSPVICKVCCKYPLLVVHSENPCGPGCTSPSFREDFEEGVGP